jgi:hypothetical protein
MYGSVTSVQTVRLRKPAGHALDLCAVRAVRVHGLALNLETTGLQRQCTVVGTGGTFRMPIGLAKALD